MQSRSAAATAAGSRAEWRSLVAEPISRLSPAPQRTWQYGEMGRASGGSLWPHQTHQNGLSADFFMPVVNEGGVPQKLPISFLNKFGYGLEFDRRGKLDDWTIDWKAVADHLLALRDAAHAHGVRVQRIIITPVFHERLFQVAPEVRRLAPLFMKKEAWVRHDEHYHVDLEIPARFRRPLICK